MSKRITLSEQERALACSAFTCMIQLLAVEVTDHGTLTKWARKEMREQILCLRRKFEEPA